MSQHQLLQYLTEARRQGMSDDDILRELTGVGWSLEDVAAFLQERLRGAPAKSGEPIIAVRQLSKSYGALKALDDISLDVAQGSITALLGPNGAGKTTLIRILTTLLPPDAGTVTVSGLDVVRDAQRLRSLIGLAGQSAAVDDVLTGRENLELVGRLYHLRSRDAKARTAELLRMFDLEEAGRRQVKTYSGGMRKRLDLAASLLVRPRMLFLDEPTTGLDPRSRFALWHVIRDLVEDGTTVLLTTQYLEEADQLADRIFVIDHGHIIAQGTADELKRQVGGDVVELHVANHSDAPRAAAAMQGLGISEPHPDPDTGIVTMPVSGGASVLVDVVRQLDAAAVPLRDVTLRRPSLDDVFLKLTGHEAA